MIEVVNLKKYFGTEQVLSEVNFSVPYGQTLCVLGPSGSGKSTLLRILSGLEEPDEGEFLINGKLLNKVPTNKRNVVYLSQEPLLFPHLSVYRNLSFGLEIRKMNKEEINNKVEELAQKLGLSDHLFKMPGQLSGGQKQRVNFGRALITQPAVFLLDEPFGSLDHHTRADMQDLFIELRKTYDMTTIFVTHDVKEALILGDQCASLDQAGHLKLYKNIRDFVEDPTSGARKEKDFWTNLLQ